MAEAKHTPGPLTVDLSGPCPTLRSDAVGPGYYSVVAVVTQRDPHPVHGGGISQATAEANAILYAAAPELVEAAVFVLAHAFERKWDGDEQAFDMLQAALKKAGRLP